MNIERTRAWFTATVRQRNATRHDTCDTEQPAPHHHRHSTKTLTKAAAAKASATKATAWESHNRYTPARDSITLLVESSPDLRPAE